ncbi:MAG: hypothetical protein E5V92_22110 [Mesorhizobium sp.]|nr:MAG: hypothetical protein E5V92_22110 [Mesorhizobium sp.]
MVRHADGAQIGVEAKMTLNAKVLLQATEGLYQGRANGEREAPDFRAALVPHGAAGVEMKAIARYLGITVVEVQSQASRDEEARAEARALAERWGLTSRRRLENDKPAFTPELPKAGGFEWREEWVDHCPSERCKVPDYVPDVAAGASGPSQLSEWKIKAIKVCIVLERRGFVTPADFRHLKIDRKRWLDMRWLTPAEERGRYIPGRSPLNLRAAHPVNYGQVEADFDKWKPEEPGEAFKPLAALL